ncbi:hypothetical protein OO015_00445 [Thermomicrobium sp. 4228-Ro]|uniref:hypothetical protein n=1 Tax=Thermomicrobium sp. 4228-Ro TaxID=2993937 RepID=UPI00224922D8|nr:hypothetical protein [Thermomicrobium sp. 4228-Ro]MCX2725976.1 hypothetical protein [Thermomicrobium sp. 4228-Ro]
MNAPLQILAEFLEDAMKGIREESARHWIRSAIRHLDEGDHPRHLAAASCCLREAARYTRRQDLRNWLQSLASHLEREAWR